ncbi:hypothetical protein ACLHDF_15130 [Priestia aryabhattai]|uniref:hypothetical protein n=1 Tax=Priestia megaterium TaxID=1404 RepID=UPI0039B9888B
MNEKMMEFFVRGIIASLPINKRMLYQFIEGVEDHLAQEAETKEQFLILLKEQSPHHQAANRFGMTIFETVTLMHEIEGEINEKLERKLDSYKWVDYTTYSKQAINSTRYYLIIS